MIDPVALQMVLRVLTGGLDRRVREAIAYLIEENRLVMFQWSADPTITPPARRS